MNESKTQSSSNYERIKNQQVTVLLSSLVQSHGTITIYINSIRIMQNLIQPFNIHKVVDTQHLIHKVVDTQHKIHLFYLS